MHNRRCAPPVRPLPARSSSCALACWSDTWWRLCRSRRMLAAPTSSTYSCARRAERNAQRVGRTQRRARAVGFKLDPYPSGGVEPCPGRFRRRTNPDRPPRLCTQVSQAISGIWWIFRGRHYQPKWRPVRPPAIVAPLRRVRRPISRALGRRTKVCNCTHLNHHTRCANRWWALAGTGRKAPGPPRLRDGLRSPEYIRGAGIQSGISHLVPEIILFVFYTIILSGVVPG